MCNVYRLLNFRFSVTWVQYCDYFGICTLIALEYFFYLQSRYKQNICNCNLNFCSKSKVERAGALVQWLWEKTHVPKVMSSNPITVYWMDIFPFICCRHCNVCLKKTKINEKEAGFGAKKVSRKNNLTFQNIFLHLAISVTKSGNLLDFGQLLNVFGIT